MNPALRAAALGILASAAASPEEGSAATTLEETRLAMGKWIETQQIISKERDDWAPAREMLLGRLELVEKEVATLEEDIAEAQSSVAEVERSRGELGAENDVLVAATEQVTEAVSAMELEVRRLLKAVPEPIVARVQLLSQRIPEDPATTKVALAERVQNVLGILNEVNKANSEITVNYEVRKLSDGSPAEVQAIYVGLAQAYFVSAGGETGIGRPGPAGWSWEPAPAAAGDVLMALDILQGKQPPAFVPLPVKLQ